ncbi:N-acetylmuramoyl-L-alanine amidase [Planococcus sp. 107-1]|uniref:N-acetylmuramoyl-L-alanine amidase n=1 Tax=Planococcus sp. 107-1 TaxID=2908840 RepID=UPI001F483424|nr:N-acetylmuramoyl-L-alanine amidase [Planococcus sp. 107-1]UJF25489.1 N-acetylmuramoyl-L-alanine amidase [Planococcus sp. 107-1]
MKKWIMMLCFALIASIIVPQSQANASANFKDIGDTHRAKAEITYLVDKGFVNGVSNTHFVPSRQVTRGEAAAMLGRSLGLNGTKQNTEFSDVGSGNFASGYINEMVKRGVISGYPDGTFKPYKVLKRGEMAILINRAFGYGGNSVSAAATNLMNKGIAQGFPDGTFGTEATIIRADFAVFLARSLNESFRVKPGEVSFSTTMYVNTGSDTLNMRSAPSNSGAVISKLKSGTAVGVGKSSNGWSHIRVNGVIGYVATSYLSTTKPGSVLPSPAPIGGSDLTVVIDPGHGGKDPGGVSNGFQEKDITLNVGLHMKSYFDKTPISIKMTRSTNVFIELNDRAKYASKNTGDVFISLHTNKFNGSAKGQETFYYASTAATNPKVQQSRALSIYLQARMQEAWNLQNRGVKVGNLAVLRDNTVPAALVEMGFIDNATDIKYLQSEAERKVMGKALFLGTLDYFYNYEGRIDVLTYYNTVGASPSKKLH